MKVRACAWRIVISLMIPQDFPSCYYSSMRNLAVLVVHLIATLAFFVWKKNSISCLAMGMSLMRANSYGRQDRSGCRYSPTTWEEMTRKILDFGVRKLDLPAPHLYFQPPGGQCFQLIGINEERSYYTGAGDGPNVAKEKEAEALKDEAMNKLALGHHQKKSTKL